MCQLMHGWCSVACWRWARYEAGLVQIIPVGEQGRLLEAFDVRIDEMCVTDVKFLDGTPAPTLAVLYVDPQRDVHIKTYTVSLKDKVRLHTCSL